MKNRKLNLNEFSEMKKQKKFSFIYRFDGSIEKVKPDSKRFNLKELQKAIGGLYEPFILPDKSVIIMHDEGRLRHLPINEFASKVAKVEIVGDVLHCSSNFYENVWDEQFRKHYENIFNQPFPAQIPLP